MVVRLTVGFALLTAVSPVYSQAFTKLSHITDANSASRAQASPTPDVDTATDSGGTTVNASTAASDSSENATATMSTQALAYANGTGVEANAQSEFSVEAQTSGSATAGGNGQDSSASFADATYLISGPPNTQMILYGTIYAETNRSDSATRGGGFVTGAFGTAGTTTGGPTSCTVTDVLNGGTANFIVYPEGTLDRTWSVYVYDGDEVTFRSAVTSGLAGGITGTQYSGGHNSIADINITGVMLTP